MASPASMETMNDGHRYSEQLPVCAAGQKLIDYLAGRWRHSNAAEWRRRIDAGLVTLDGHPAVADARLRAGQTLVWNRPAWDEPAAPVTFAVLYADDELLAVAKPSGLPTLPGGGFLHSTLLECVRRFAPGAAPLHRLGRFTSGIVLFSRQARAHEALSRQFRERTIGKLYRALAAGSPERDRFEIDAPIGPVPYAPLGTLHAVAIDGRDAQSRVVVVERRANAFLCDVEIETGRPHQIRIHLAAAGHPLVGDPLYAAGGLPLPGGRALPGDPGYLLHATELRFTHPSSGGEIRVRCAPPPALRPTRRGCELDL